MNDFSKLKNILSSLMSHECVSGEEYNMTEALENLFEKKSRTDNLNSIIFESTDENKFLLDAHIDKIGFKVTDITDNGFVKVGPVGGIDVRTLCACDVTIYTDDGKIKGVVTSIPPHLAGKEDDAAPDVFDILIDVGYNKNCCEKIISRGDTVGFSYKTEYLLNNTVTGVSLDNKAGAAVLIRAFQQLKEKGLDKYVTFLFSSQEEVGLRGAKASSFAIEAKESIVVDVSFATAPDVDKLHAGELSKGPMICVSPTVSKAMSDKLKECAEKNKIDYQLEVCSGNTGTNADVISLSADGKKTALVSVPLRNMHTYSEIVSLEDIENAAKLIVLYIERRVSEID